MRVPSIPFCPLRSSIRVTFEKCALQGVWNALCACTKTESSSRFVRVYFFAVFVISSTPMPSSRLGPTDRYDGDAQVRKSSAGALQLGDVLRLFPFANSEKVHFCSFHHIHVQWLQRRHVRLKFSFHFSDVDHMCIHSPTRSWQCHVGLHLFFIGSRTRKVKKKRLRTPMPLPPSSCVSLCNS